MILLNDILGFSEEEFSHIKVKLNQWDGNDNPIELFKTNPDEINKQWLFWRAKQRYFNVGQTAICLAQISGDYWLLTTIKKITKELGVKNGINYEGEEIDKFKPFFGRLVIKYHKADRVQCPFYYTIYNSLEVNEILSDTFDDDDFPGYDNVKLSYRKLSSILERGKHDWISALENQKAVYLITDTSNGKLYVGSATSEKGMLLQRWRSYIKNGHGGNKNLIELIKDKGFDYVKNNFQYSILENYNAKVDDYIIRNRESWWKEVLKTRQFGYNEN